MHRKVFIYKLSQNLQYIFVTSLKSFLWYTLSEFSMNLREYIKNFSFINFIWIFSKSLLIHQTFFIHQLIQDFQWIFVNTPEGFHLETLSQSSIHLRDYIKKFSFINFIRVFNESSWIHQKLFIHKVDEDFQ